MTLGDIQLRLIELLRSRVRNGEISERALAKLVGISQPHIHNVLSGKRAISLDACDQIMRKLRLGIFDLIDYDDWSESRAQQRTPNITNRP